MIEKALNENRTFKLDTDEVFHTIAKEGAEPWILSKLDHKAPLRIKQDSLNMEARLWYQIISSYIDPTSHEPTVKMDTVILIWAIMKKKKVYISRIIKESFRHVFTVNKYRLPVPSMIMKLATKAGVAPRLGDEIFDIASKQGIIPYGNWEKQGGGGPTKKRKVSSSRVGLSAPPPRATRGFEPSNQEIMDELRRTNQRLKNLEELLSQVHPGLDYSRLEPDTPEHLPIQELEDKDVDEDTGSAEGSEQHS